MPGTARGMQRVRPDRPNAAGAATTHKGRESQFLTDGQGGLIFLSCQGAVRGGELMH